MAIFSVRFCLPALVACVIVNIALVQGRSLKRRHGHHTHSDYYNFEESLPRHLSGRLEDDRDYYEQMERREYPHVLDRSSEYSEERVPFLRRYRQHGHGLRDRESLRRRENSLRKHEDFDALSMRFVARRKRHNKRGNIVNYQSKKNSILWWQPEEMPSGEKAELFELEVKEAQNSSICNYTVESVPDTRGSRVPKDLEHVRCNHIGSSCQSTGTYCCIQTYKNIEVSYGDGNMETMKLYVGCVCALQVLNDTQVMGWQLSINN